MLRKPYTYNNPGLKAKNEIKITPLNWTQVYAVKKCVELARTEEYYALDDYLDPYPPKSVVGKGITLFFTLAEFLLQFQQGIGLQAEDCKAVGLWQRPSTFGKFGWPWVITVLGWVRFISTFFYSSEMTARREEYGSKMGQLCEKLFGERYKEMYELAGLATRPDAQRQGLGSALICKYTRVADAQGRACFLSTTKEKSANFYRHHGFQVAGQYLLGDTNHLWKKAGHEPVTVMVMKREPKL